MKLVVTFMYLISLFLFSSFTAYAVVTLFLFGVIKASNVPFGHIVKGLKAILFLLIFTAFFNIFWTPGTIFFQWKFISITYQGLRSGTFMAMRLIYLIIGSSILTFTTTPNQLTDAIENLLKPLSYLKVPVHDFAMMMSLALRFIPILLEEANRIMDAQTARGADFEEGKLWQRMRSIVSILVPLLVSATKRAYDLAMAMEARCYRGGNNRTKMKPLAYKKRDVIAYIVSVAYLISILLINRLFVI